MVVQICLYQKIICKNFQLPDNNICEKLDQKQIKLQTDIQNIVEQNLKAISQYAENGGAQEEYVPEQMTTETTIEDVPVTNYSDDNEPTTTGGNSVWNLFLLLIFSFLLAAIIWLYKQQMDL